MFSQVLTGKVFKQVWRVVNVFLGCFLGVSQPCLLSSQATAQLGARLALHSNAHWCLCILTHTGVSTF
jgi:hypothetical protein